MLIYWINIYLGTPKYITYNTGKDFSSTKFHWLAKAFAIEVKKVLVEAYNSIGKVERYYIPLRQAYNIIFLELRSDAHNEIVLQMAVKAVNHSAS